MVIRATTAKLSLGQEHPAAPQPHCSLGNGLGDALAQADPAPSHLGAGICVCVCVSQGRKSEVCHITATLHVSQPSCRLTALPAV